MPTQLKHETMKVRAIIQDFRDGRLLVPEFQRDYVWAKSRAPKLIDSLYRRYPISSLLIWETEERVEVRRSEPRRALNVSPAWLIDGQQRVTTLARTMSGDEIEVVFNLDDEGFSRPNVATKQNARCVKVGELWDEECYLRLRRDLPDDSRLRRTEDRLERMRDVLDYEVPIVRMIGGYTFEDAAEAFRRINSYGVRLKDEDLQSARIAAKHSGFIRRKVIPLLHNLHARGYTRIFATHLFRVCAFIAHPDARQKTPLHELESREVESAWRRTRDAVERALGLVGSELGIADMSVLWSGSLLVPVIALCATASPKERDDRELAGWVAAAALRHRYSRSTDTALEQDLRACRNDDPIRSLLANLKQKTGLWASPGDFAGNLADRSGLLATYIACKHLGARDLLHRGRILSRSGIDRHHILPRSLFQPRERYRADVLANIAFVASDSNRSISDSNPATYLASIDTAVLESQAIPTDQSLWDVNRADEFWAQRRKLLADALNDYLRSALPKRRKIG
jgi:hypothetical protein